MVFYISCFLLVAKSAMADDLLKEMTYRNGAHVDNYRLTKSRLRAVPIWDEKSDIPLTPLRAKQIAEAFLGNNFKANNLMTESICAQKIVNTQWWYYVIHIIPSDFMEGEKPSSYVIVLMDGTILKPVKI